MRLSDGAVVVLTAVVALAGDVGLAPDATVTDDVLVSGSDTGAVAVTVAPPCAGSGADS